MLFPKTMLILFLFFIRVCRYRNVIPKPNSLLYYRNIYILLFPHKSLQFKKCILFFKIKYQSKIQKINDWKGSLTSQSPLDATLEKKTTQKIVFLSRFFSFQSWTYKCQISSVCQKIESLIRIYKSDKKNEYQKNKKLIWFNAYQIFCVSSTTNEKIDIIQNDV